MTEHRSLEMTVDGAVVVTAKVTVAAVVTAVVKLLVVSRVECEINWCVILTRNIGLLRASSVALQQRPIRCAQSRSQCQTCAGCGCNG